MLRQGSCRSRASTEEVLGIVREGTGQMPPISARQLADEDVARIVAYLQSLSR